MKKIIVLARHAEFMEAVKAAFQGADVRLSQFSDADEAEPLLVHGLCDICIADGEVATLPPALLLEKIKRRAPRCPVILFLGPSQRGEEEQAYLRGANQVLEKPVRPRLLAQMVERATSTPVQEPQPGTSFFSAPKPPSSVTEPAGQGMAHLQEALRLMRGFSVALANASDSQAMVGQFLWQVRETFSIGRCAVFLRTGQDTRMRPAAGLGISPSLLQCFELSSTSGIGGFATRSSRIVRRGGDESLAQPEITREFDVLGMEVALPILHADGVLGVALLDRRITGDPLSNPELEVIYRFLEQLGLALHNARLQTELVSTNELVVGILREISSACVVIRGDDLAILHYNKMAQKFFPSQDPRSAGMSFVDLPRPVAEQVYKVLKTGGGANFEYSPETRRDTVYQINIVPFQRKATGLPESALVVVEDRTQSVQLQKESVKSARLEKITHISRRLAEEIGNASMPVVFNQQMISKMLASDKVKLDELRALEQPFADAVKRIRRRVDQWRYLAHEGVAAANSRRAEKPFPVTQLIEEAFEEACKHQMVKSPKIDLDPAEAPPLVNGDREALRMALAEVILNALQANPTEPRIRVRFSTVANNGHGNRNLEIEVSDNGEGFTAEALQHAGEPFYTTRVVGMGLGLAVSRKILESHRGGLEIVPPKADKPGAVKILLPAETTTARQN